MPLKKGSSRGTISSNIRSEMHSYDRKGSIGNAKPASRKKAQKQAVAIALNKARESGGGPPKKRASSKKTGSAAKKSSSSRSSSRKSTGSKSSSGRSAAKKTSTSRNQLARGLKPQQPRRRIVGTQVDIE